MLDAAHRGYEYQDLLTAARLTDLVLGRIVRTHVDEKLFPTDLFDDLTVHESDGRRERIQIKHTTADSVALPLATFTTDLRNLKLDDLLASIIADRDGPGAGGASTLYRVVTRNIVPTDLALLRVLRPCASDPGPFLPGMASSRLQFNVAVLWPSSPLVAAGPSSDPFAFLRTEHITREDCRWACEHLVIEVGASVASFDLTTPGPAERLLLDRVRQDVGAESYPNASRTAIDVASAFVAVVRGARQRTTTISAEELLRRARLRTDFGAVARSHPVNSEIEVRRPHTVQEIIKRAQNAADRGEPLLLVGPPGQGKSWCCHQVVAALPEATWLVAEHYCYLGQADSERQMRVLGESMFGSLLHRLAEAEPSLVADQRPRLAAGARELSEALERARRQQPDRRVALIVDGLDHVTRVVGANTGRADPSRMIADELAALDLPVGCVLVVLSQPGDHLDPIRERGAQIIDMPPLGADELAAFAERLGVVGVSTGSATTVPSRAAPPLIDAADDVAVTAFLAALLDRSAGNALYATYLCREVLRQATAHVNPAATIQSLPPFDGTLEAYYGHLVGTLESGAGVVADLLALVDFPLTRAELREIRPTVGHRIDGALDRLAPVLVEQAGQSGVRVYHESFARFLCRPFSNDPAASTALLGAVTEWLTSKGLFSEPRAFRFLLPTLARSGRDRDAVELITIEFTMRAVAAGFTASAITANLTVGAGCAARLGDWPAVIRCIELSRAAITFEEDCLSDPLARFLDVPMALLKPEVFAERLLHDGQTTLSARLGLELCAASDKAGASAPWHEYLGAFDRERETDNTSYGNESERRVALAYLRGRLRVAADSMSGPDCAPKIGSRKTSRRLSPDRVAKWLRGKDLPARAIVDTMCDTLGAAFAEKTLKRLEEPPDLVLALAERLSEGRDALSLDRVRHWNEAAVRNPLPGNAHRLLALGRTIGDLGHLTPPSRDRLFAVTREVQASGVQFSPAPISVWLDLCTFFARSDSLGLASAEALISGDGWYRCWLRFVVALSRAEASPPEQQSAAAAAALNLLTEDLSPFSGTPRACDLFKLDDIIEATFRRALGLLTDQDWPRGLDVLRRVSDGITTTLQGVFGGPLPPTTLLALAVDGATSARRPAVDALAAQVLATGAGHRLYSYLAEFHLTASRIALAGGDRESASARWMDACRLMTAYGWHKDITIYELLDPLPSLIAADMKRAREALEFVQPLCWRVSHHTDGKETRHAPARWWRLLADADPAALAGMIAPALLRDCNMPHAMMEDSRLDLWQAQNPRADPLVAGALRLSLEPGLDGKDPDALSRLADYAQQTPSKGAAELIRLLLARADERPIAYSVTDQDELLARDRTTIEELNRVADRVDAPRLEVSMAEGAASADTAKPPRARGAESVHPTKVWEGRIVDAFAQGAVGIGRALRVWSTRPYQAQGWKWESDRFVNAIGFRLLELVDRGQMVDAEVILSMTAAGQTIRDEGGLLAALGAGLEARGQTRLAAVAFAFAWTRTRGGGGWVNFGGETSLDLLERAASLDGEAALRTIGDEARRVASEGGLGVCRALVQAFARIDFAASSTESSRAEWRDTAFACWNEAAKVIAFRTPRADSTDEPLCSYHVSAPVAGEGSRSISSAAGGDAGAKEVDRVGAGAVGQTALDQALATATVAGLAHPGREQKRRTLLAICLLLDERTDLAAEACSIALENISDPLTLSWLLRAIETSPSREKVVKRCTSALRARSQGPYLTVRALAARLLASLGHATDPPPPSVVETSTVRKPRRDRSRRGTPIESSGRDEASALQRAGGIVTRSAGNRLGLAEAVFPGVTEAVERRVALDIENEERKDRWKYQARALVSPSNKRVPDAVVWLVEIVEDALQRAAAEGRACLAGRGELVSDPAAWEDELAETLLNDPWLPLALERRREPRPANAPTPIQANGTVRTYQGHLAPLVDRGTFAGWRVIASVEWRTEPSTWQIALGATTALFCGIEHREPDDATGLEHPPLRPGDADLWRSSLDMESLGEIPFFSGPVVAVDAGGSALGDIDDGLGLPTPVLVPAPWLVMSLRLRPGDEPLQIVDNSGTAMSVRTWRGRYQGSEYELARPLLHGAQLLLRSDLFERLSALTGGKIIWREFASMTASSVEHDRQAGEAD